MLKHTRCSGLLIRSVVKRLLALLVVSSVLVVVGMFPRVGQSANLSNASVLHSNSRPSFLATLSSNNTEGSSQVEIDTTPGGLPSLSARQLQTGDTLSIGETSGFLVRDEFSDTLAAGSVNGTNAVPGPGVRTVVDTENMLSVAGGLLSLSGKSVSSYTDPRLVYDAVNRSPGVVMMSKIRRSSTVGQFSFGFSPSASSLSNTGHFFSGSQFLYTGGANITSYTLAANTDYLAATILRSSGATHFIKGGAYTNWTLLWTLGQPSDALLHPYINIHAQSATVDYLRVLQLPAPFNSDYGLATDHKPGNVTAGTTFTHEADAVIEWTVDALPSVNYMEMHVRRQDDMNTWLVRITSDGSFRLLERENGGSSIQRANAVAVVSPGDRIVIVVEGNTIRGYSNNVLRWSYNSAISGANRTAGSVRGLGWGAEISNLTTWPRTLSGSAAQILDQMSAPVPEGQYALGGEYTVTDITAEDTFSINAGLATGDADPGDVVVSTQLQH